MYGFSGTACLGFRSGESISNAEVDDALNGRGPVENYTLERYQSGPYNQCTVCRVTFAYVDDCRDAIRVCLFDPIPPSQIN